MLFKQQRQLINYQKITIYEQVYKLPVLNNTRIKAIQKRVEERRRLIKEGVRYRRFLWGIIKRKEEIDQEKIFQDSKLLIKDYIYLIDFLLNYEVSYQNFLLKLTEDLKKLFLQKYLETKNLDKEREKLEIKNYRNQRIVEELEREKEENLKASLLLSNACFLTLEKIKLLSEGLKTIAKTTKSQKQIVQQIAKDFEVYQDVYKYKIKAQKFRQEIVELVETAMKFENYLKDCFGPFQSLIDEVVKVDEDFYATVGDIQNLVDNILKSDYNLLTPKENTDISEDFLNFMVSSYEKKERLKDALIQCQMLGQIPNFDLANNLLSVDKEIDSISNYIFKQLTPSKEKGIAETNFISITPLPGVQETGLIGPSNQDTFLAKESKNKYKVDYTKLQTCLAQHKWKEADTETTILLLKIMGKSYWNEVYQEDINNFSCKDLQTIDQLWEEYSYGYFGFSVQQSIWSAMGGQVDYETEKLLGDRFGWRKQGNWLDYDQLAFELSPTTPKGHLPAQWLYYDYLSPKLSADHLSVGAWRVGSWLVWLMHLLWYRVKNCNETCLRVDSKFVNNRDNYS